MLYRHFPCLPFYARWGAIPESYLIALSYEEQLLWLCKHLEELDEKIDKAFADLKEYIDNALDSIENAILELDGKKQDKLIAGDNIVISGNVISAVWGTNVSSLIEYGYAVPFNLHEGQYLPMPPFAQDDTAVYIEEGIHEGDTYKLLGKFNAYVIDPSTNEILYNHQYPTPDIDNPTRITFISQADGTLVIDFEEVSRYGAEVFKQVNLDRLEQDVEQLKVNKQDKLTAGENINIDSNNVISAYIGENLESDIAVGWDIPPDTPLGETLLPPREVGGSETAVLTINEVHNGDKFKVRGYFSLYVVDPTTSEVLYSFFHEPSADENELINVTLGASGKLYCGWYQLPLYEAEFIRIYNLDMIEEKALEVDSKQDKLTAGENINIDSNNVISAYIGENLESDIAVGWDIPPDTPLGDTLLPPREVGGTETAVLTINEVHSGDKFKVRGYYSLYVVDPTTSEVLYEFFHTPSHIENDLIDVEIGASGKLYCGWYQLPLYEAEFIRIYNLDMIEEKALEVDSKQDKLIEGDFINLEMDNRISAIIGADITSGIVAFETIANNLNVGDILPQPTSAMDSDILDVGSVNNGDKFFIKGDYTAYIYDTTTREIKSKFSSNDTEYYTTVTSQFNDCNIAICFYNTTGYTEKVIRQYNLDSMYSHMETIDSNITNLQNNKQNKLTRRGLINIDSTNQIYTMISCGTVTAVYNDESYGINYDVGDTLPQATSALGDDTAVVTNISAHERFFARADFIAYLIDTTTREILAKYQSSDNTQFTEFRIGSATIQGHTAELDITFFDTDLQDYEFYREVDLEKVIKKIASLEADVGDINTALTTINTGSGV